MKNLINNEKVGAIIEMYPGDTVEYYDKVFDKFRSEYKGNKFDWVNMQSFWESQKIGTMYYNYDLCRDGMIARLYCFSGETDDQIEDAKKKLRHDHDVVSLRVIKIKLVPFSMPERTVKNVHSKN